MLCREAVYNIHAAAREMRIPKRQPITNGFFSRDEEEIRRTALRLARSGVNEILLSVDAFHQETIPPEPVKLFAQAVKDAGVPIRTHPAWLVSPEDKNPYNERTIEILEEFLRMGIAASEGNTIFPGGNALKYLKEYFEPGEKPVSPYQEKTDDIHAICIAPDGDVLGGNIYRQGIWSSLKITGHMGARANHKKCAASGMIGIESG